LLNDAAEDIAKPRHSDIVRVIWDSLRTSWGAFCD
jgi:hypothetical protein